MNFALKFLNDFETRYVSHLNDRHVRNSTQNFYTYIQINFYLEIHNRFRYFNIDGFNNHNNIEWAKQTFRYAFHRYNEIVPFHVQLLIVIQATLHHIHAIIWTWFFHVPAACATLLHFGQGGNTFRRRFHIDHVSGNIGRWTKCLFKCTGRNKRTFYLSGEFFRYIAEWFQLFHVFTDTFQVPIVDKGVEIYIYTD